MSSSLREGHPLAVIEAMSMGLPVVASNVPGNNETIKHGSSGFYYDLGNIKQASHYLTLLACNFELRKKLATNAQAYQRENFSSISMSKTYLEVYNQLWKGYH